MNTEDMLKELASLLNSFFIHPKFLEELRTLLKTDLKGKESIFFKILTTQLSNIKNFGSKIYTIDSNEILQGADGHYYSIHLQKSQFNVRLIVYINDENIHNYVKKSLEVSRDYDMDSIIESDEDEVEREIDKIFNRLCKCFRYRFCNIYS